VPCTCGVQIGIVELSKYSYNYYKYNVEIFQLKKHFYFLVFLLVACILNTQCVGQAKLPHVEGLQMGSLNQAGIDSGKIVEMENELAKGKQNIHSVLILRHNKLVYEKYFSGKDEIFATPRGVVNHTRDSLHDCRSITKSVVSACIGIAISQGKIKSVNDRVFDFFPEYKKYDTGAKRELTIKHLLTMSDGLEWNERIPYNDPKNSEIQMLMNPDVVDFVLSRPSISKPGSAWNYSGGTTQLLAKILERVSGLKVDSFANKHIFLPLGTKRFAWYEREDGTPWAPSGLRLRPIDMAKFGLLYLNNGNSNDKQVVPAEWVKESITLQIKRQGSSGYGYQFWCGTDTILGKGVNLALAIGFGGQRIYLIPSLDLCIVATAGNYDDKSDLTDLVVEKFIKPSIQR
jgi:CubicO group peptidase (beta-lactamase class C family)